MYPIKPRNTGSLIPPGAAEDLVQQDAARLEARKDPRAAQARLTRSILGQVSTELVLIHWGAEADTVQTPFGEEVVRPIRSKYQMRSMTAFERWMLRFGFHFPPAHGLKGFTFNEGGHGVTLTWLPNRKLYRLYVAGYELMLRSGRWSFKKLH